MATMCPFNLFTSVLHADTNIMGPRTFVDPIKFGWSFKVGIITKSDALVIKFGSLMAFVVS